MVTEKYKFDPLYVNGRRITTLVGSPSVFQYVGGALGLSQKEQDYQISVAYAELLRRWLAEAGKEVAPFEVDWASGRIAPNRVFTVQRHFTFRNARALQKNVEPLAYTTFPELGPDGSDLRLELALHPSHVVVGSPGDLMAGKVSDLFVCALVLESSAERVAAVPLFIGHLLTQGPEALIVDLRHGELHPERIDNFAAMKSLRDPPLKQLEALRKIPEHDVKTAFAEIIGETDVPKDWGGERSDLFSTHVSVDGRRVSSAFMFKGPAGGAKFRPMGIPDLGLRGDQIERLTTEPADLLILQHCHKVTTGVRSMLRAFCNQHGRQRSYCVITGYETYRILRAYKKCGL
ncbi:MAG: hypothetical protein R3B70_21990 [Polyangiaceae bacterium]